jgi:hypothetical protein
VGQVANLQRIFNPLVDVRTTPGSGVTNRAQDTILPYKSKRYPARMSCIEIATKASVNPIMRATEVHEITL